jgi:hypothetical protein
MMPSSAAVIAAGRSPVTEMPRFVNVDVDIQRDGVGHVQQEIAEHRAGRSCADDGNSGAVLQRAGLDRARLLSAFAQVTQISSGIHLDPNTLLRRWPQSCLTGAPNQISCPQMTTFLSAVTRIIDRPVARR